MYRSTIKLLVLLLCVGLCACEQSPPTAKPIRPVLSQLVEFSTDWRESTYAGQIRARYVTALSFRLGGKLIERPVEVGDRVEAGTVLARLDPEDVRLRLVEAEAGVAEAQAEQNKAASDLERYRGLRKKNLVSKIKYTEFTNRHEVAKARLQQAQAELEVTRNQAAYTTLSAHRAGVVTETMAEVGQVVTAGQTVVRLTLAGDREVEIAIPENRLTELRQADTIQVSLWADAAASYTGRVREVSPGADPVTRTYSVRITLPDAGPEVQLGMTATVTIRKRREGEVAHLPLSALYQRDSEPAVWVVDGALRVELVPVDVLEFTQTEVLVSGGLDAGQRVVTAGVHKLAPGQRVRVPETE